MDQTHFDVIVVGSGMAGLTAAAYLGQASQRTLLLEKEDSFGGLLGAFEWNGHTLDKGARGIIDSGIIFPMLRQLGIRIDFLENPIRMTLSDRSMEFRTKADLNRYTAILKDLFPSETTAIDAITQDILKIMGHMDVLYGIENPLFLPKPYDMGYLGKTLLPWMFRFLYHIRQTGKYMAPVDEYLKTKTSNQALIDMIAQHFFAKTPTFFALSYFTLYLQYHYPKGSTQSVIDGLISSLKQSGVQLRTKSEVLSIDPEAKTITTQDHQIYAYDQLIWAADTNRLYSCLEIGKLKSEPLRKALEAKRDFYRKQKGADSILTLYLLSDLDPETFRSKNGPHGFFTPELEGLSSVPYRRIQDENGSYTQNPEELWTWLNEFLRVNTFEISIPALRDPNLSPKGKSALIVSFLFDYDLTMHLVGLGFYEEFKERVTRQTIELLKAHLWPILDQHIEGIRISSPKTIYERTYATQGSVTGWSFANIPFPAIHQFTRVAQSVFTPIPSIKQAGQFTFNPAGVPVAAMTGKLAADAVLKDLKKDKTHD